MKNIIGAKTDSGFTLLELLISLAIMAVICAVAVPNLLSYLVKSRLNGAARQVATDLMAARMEAVKHNCKSIIGFETDHTYYIVTDKNSNKAYDSGEPRIVKNLHDNYDDVINIKPDTKNIFNSRGAADRYRIIELQNPCGTKKISVSISGRVKIN
jgi:type IV fimbrial biogenesis protein FimT